VVSVVVPVVAPVVVPVVVAAAAGLTGVLGVGAAVWVGGDVVGTVDVGAAGLAAAGSAIAEAGGASRDVGMRNGDACVDPGTNVVISAAAASHPRTATR